MTNYAYQGELKVARAYGRKLPISTKQSVEICKAIKGKRVDSARRILEDAKNMIRPIKYTRFTEGAGHKPGMGSAKYPIKAVSHIVKVLNSAEANAQDQGMGSDLIVESAVANEAARSYRYGRQSRRKEKGTHVELIIREATEADKKKERKAPKKQTKPKKEEKKAEKAKPVVAEKTPEVKEEKKPEVTETKEEVAKEEPVVEEKATEEKVTEDVAETQDTPAEETADDAKEEKPAQAETEETEEAGVEKTKDSTEDKTQ